MLSEGLALQFFLYATEPQGVPIQNDCLPYLVSLKKLFAVSMQGAVIFLIIYVTDIFKDSLGASFSVITNTAINLTMIGMFAKSRQIANDIIGVH